MNAGIEVHAFTWRGSITRNGRFELTSASFWNKWGVSPALPSWRHGYVHVPSTPKRTSTVSAERTSLSMSRIDRAFETFPQGSLPGLSFFKDELISERFQEHR